MNASEKPIHFDPGMLALFRNELSLQTSRFQDAMAFEGTEKEVLEGLENMIEATKVIRSSAYLMNLVSIVDLAKELGLLFHRMKKEVSKTWSKYKTVLQLAFDHFNALVQCPEAMLALQVLNRDLQIEATTKAIKSILEGEGDSDAENSKLLGKESQGGLDLSLLDFFKLELEHQTTLLSDALIGLEQNEQPKAAIEAMLRSAHSIKGAARVVNLTEISQLAHLFEDVLIGIKDGQITMSGTRFDILLQFIDFLFALSHLDSSCLYEWLKQKKEALEELNIRLLSLSSQSVKNESGPVPRLSEPFIKTHPFMAETQITTEGIDLSPDRVLRVTAHNLNQLMGLAGESMVESRWLYSFSQSLMHLKKNLNEFIRHMDSLKADLQHMTGENSNSLLKQLSKRGEECQRDLNLSISDLDLFINRNSSLSDRLYREVVDSRMRSFADGVEAFPRMIRDLARQLNKKVHFEIHGKSTPVDREILEKLEAPLAHLLRNAVGHGIESREERLAAGKPEEGSILLEAQHRAGMLSITVTDDGRGVDFDKIRKKVIEKGMAKPELAAQLSEKELMEFLFLPGFTTVETVTEISGRGFGLNVVQNMLQEVSGNINARSKLGGGMSFNLQMPLTLSVIRALIIEVAKEPYAIALSRIDRTLFVPQDSIELVENRQYFRFEGKNIGMISAGQILGFEEVKRFDLQLPVVIVNDRMNSYGLVVDSFLGERELVVQKLDQRLGKLQDISAGAFLADGTPVLILDVEDIICSMENILTTGSLSNLTYSKVKEPTKHIKRILVIDDSITVREVECRLLRNRGYEVETAINGMEGWNALRNGNFDLVVTDVDMPRMNGIDLVRAIKSDARLRSLPVMIVSYKEHDDDRLKGLEAGANYYLTKSSFHDEALINAVADLIGEA